MDMQNDIWKLKIVFMPVNPPSARHMALPGTKPEDRDKRKESRPFAPGGCLWAGDESAQQDS